MAKRLIIPVVIVLVLVGLVIARSPASRFYYNKGLEYKQEEMYEQAGIYFSRAVLIRSGFLEARFEKGLMELYLENYGEAADWFTQIIERDNEFAPAWFQRGISSFESGEYQHAV
jgi:tetratricopeptide (TPR) repeat protein